jgi:hypothetical protein
MDEDIREELRRKDRKEEETNWKGKKQENKANEK